MKKATKKAQRGIAVLSILALVSVAGFGASLMPKAYPGTYQFVPAGGNVLKIDTRNGVVERCRVVGDNLKCDPLEPAASLRVSDQ